MPYHGGLKLRYNYFYYSFIFGRQANPMKKNLFPQLILTLLLSIGLMAQAYSIDSGADYPGGNNDDTSAENPNGTFIPPASDATKVRPQTTGSYNMYYPSQTVTSPPIDNNSWFLSLNPCPNTITNCPTINTNPNNPSEYDPPTCPKACSVTQSPYTGPTADFKNAICPPGYSQVGSFNSQPEYAWSTNPPSKTPTDMSEYNQYTTTGYSCAGNGTDESWRDSCDASRKWGNGVYTDQMSTASGNVVYIRNIQEDCYTSCETKVNTNCSNKLSVSQYTYKFQRVICTAPPGNYPTGNYLPGSVACARNTPTWQSHQ